jgi:hypothetical protein
MSEPEFLISVMDRHPKWATIVCLIGGGQEINTGEAGLLEWFKALKSKFPNWNVYISDRLSDSEYTRGSNIKMFVRPDRLVIDRNLHLAVSVRSFRSEKVSAFVKSVLDIEREKAEQLLKAIQPNYPIYVTRDLFKAKEWIKMKARGTERYGIIASSRGRRLRPYGINVKNSIDPAKWFLNGKKDIRSSFFMEDVATEFDIQGLELDWALVAWDADLRFTGITWEFKDFVGTRWNNVNNRMRALYLLNTYRVLLTRARQGFVIFLPVGDSNDETRLPSFYNGTYQYLRELGIPSM